MAQIYTESVPPPLFYNLYPLAPEFLKIIMPYNVARYGALQTVIQYYNYCST